MSFQVKIEVFEGPFDLLLQLITRQELDIHEVPVAHITTAFIEHMETMPRLDLDTATEFMVIAATLLLIKARSLLASGEEEDEEAADTESAREYLIERLVEYKQFANAADWLADRYAEHGSFIRRAREMEEDYAHLYPDPFVDVEALDLAKALMDLLVERASAKVDTSYIAPIKVSVAERVEAVRERVAREGTVKFSTLVADCSSKLELIATFLAILELSKRGEVTLSQRKLFGEIDVKRREASSNVA